MAEVDSFLHLARPLGPVTVGSAPTTAPLNVIIQPQVCCYGARGEGMGVLLELGLWLTFRSGGFLDPGPFSPSQR